MSITITKPTTNLIGASPAAPATIAGGAVAGGTMSMSAGAGSTEGNVAIGVITGSSPPASAILVQCSYSNDGTNYIPDPTGTYPVGTPAANTTYTFRYDPPGSAHAVQVQITNGSTNSITAFAQGSTTEVS